MMEGITSVIYNSRIKSATFYVSGTEDVKNESTVPVTSYDLLRGGKPIDGGVHDSHLGTIDYGYRCKTCKHNKNNCLGHDGHLILNYPLQSPFYILEIRKWLRVICLNCGNCVLPRHDIAVFGRSKRLTEAAKLAKTGKKQCPVCNAIHPAISKDADNPCITYVADIDGVRKLYPHEIREIFTKVSNETVDLLGKNEQSHPSKFILGAIKIPSITIRPDTRAQGSSKATSNDITTNIQAIVKKHAGFPSVIPDEITAAFDKEIYLLQDAFYAYIKGSPANKSMSRNTSAPVKSLGADLRGKKGKLRKHQLGKRVRAVARSTIIGDPNLEVDVVGVPYKFVKILQVEDTVQDYNKAQLMINFMNGRKKYPGCSKIRRKSTGTEYSVEDNSMEELEIGDIIHRDLQDGDIVYYCRQPSLLPSNISAMRVHVIMNTTILAIKMNVLSCPLFHADFDGDRLGLSRD